MELSFAYSGKVRLIRALRDYKQRSLTVLGAKKPINIKHINIFLTALAGQSSRGRTPTCPRDKRDKQNGDFTVEFNRERPVCPRDGFHFVPGRGPICPRDGSCLSRSPAENVYVYWFFLARLFSKAANPPNRRGTFLSNFVLQRCLTPLVSCLSCTRLWVPPVALHAVALHVLQLISWIL